MSELVNRNIASEILTILKESKREWTIKELQDRLQLSRTVIYLTVKTLIDVGIIVETRKISNAQLFTIPEYADLFELK